MFIMVQLSDSNFQEFVKWNNESFGARLGIDYTITLINDKNKKVTLILVKYEVCANNAEMINELVALIKQKFPESIVKLSGPDDDFETYKTASKIIFKQKDNAGQKED